MFVGFLVDFLVRRLVGYAAFSRFPDLRHAALGQQTFQKNNPINKLSKKWKTRRSTINTAAHASYIAQKMIQDLSNQCCNCKNTEVCEKIQWKKYGKGSSRPINSGPGQIVIFIEERCKRQIFLGFPVERRPQTESESSALVDLQTLPDLHRARQVNSTMLFTPRRRGFLFAVCKICAFSLAVLGDYLWLLVVICTVGKQTLDAQRITAIAENAMT